MQAWFYIRGELEEVPGEHPGVIARIAKGHVRVRFHEDSSVLAAQGRSRSLVMSAIRTVMDRGLCMPEKLELQWPGKFIELDPSEA